MVLLHYKTTNNFNCNELNCSSKIGGGNKKLPNRLPCINENKTVIVQRHIMEKKPKPPCQRISDLTSILLRGGIVKVQKTL